MRLGLGFCLSLLERRLLGGCLPRCRLFGLALGCQARRLLGSSFLRRTLDLALLGLLRAHEGRLAGGEEGLLGHDLRRRRSLCRLDGGWFGLRLLLDDRRLRRRKGLGLRRLALAAVRLERDRCRLGLPGSGAVVDLLLCRQGGLGRLGRGVGHAAHGLLMGVQHLAALGAGGEVLFATARQVRIAAAVGRSSLFPSRPRDGLSSHHVGCGLGLLLAGCGLGEGHRVNRTAARRRLRRARRVVGGAEAQGRCQVEGPIGYGRAVGRARRLPRGAAATVAQGRCQVEAARVRSRGRLRLLGSWDRLGRRLLSRRLGRRSSLRRDVARFCYGLGLGGRLLLGGRCGLCLGASGRCKERLEGKAAARFVFRHKPAPSTLCRRSTRRGRRDQRRPFDARFFTRWARRKASTARKAAAAAPMIKPVWAAEVKYCSSAVESNLSSTSTT